MSPLHRVDWDWFLGTLLVLMLALVAYTIENGPGPRPTESVTPVESPPCNPKGE